VGKEMKLINDTLKINGRYAHKRIMAFVSFHSMIVYVFLPVVFPLIDVKEFVVCFFLGYSGACLGIDLQQQIKLKDLTNKEDQL
jgi:hypothetical protein